jgi:hypothetical protein
MNKNYLILLIIIISIIIYSCWNNQEDMAVVSASIYLKGEKLKEIYDLTQDQLENIPIIDRKVINDLKLLVEETNNETLEETNEETNEETDEETIEETNEETNEEILEETNEETKKKIIKPLDPIWEEKRMPSESILEILQTKIKECGVDKLNLTLKDIVGLPNRKKFIQLLPILRSDIKNKINYDQIKCFVSKYDPNNFINIVEVQSKLPRYLPYNNLTMINSFLYHFTPYGVLKYSLTHNKQVDLDDNVVVASMEASMINNINKYNDSAYIIIPLKGSLYQIKNGQFFNIKTGDNVDIISIIKRRNKAKLQDLKQKELLSEKQLILKNKDLVDEEDESYYKFHDEYIYYKNKYLDLKTRLDSNNINDEIEEEVQPDIQVEDEEIKNIKNKLISQKAELPEKFFRRTLYVINYSKDMYIIKPTRVIPNRGLGKSVNNIIKKHDIVIRGVMPHFYNGKDKKFHVDYLFLCSSNFYFTFSDGQLSKLSDFSKDYKFVFTKNLKYELSCEEYKTILDQLVQSNKISISKKNKILNNMKCFDDSINPIDESVNLID